MPLYAYRAMDLAGQMVPGAMDATNSADLELRLRRMELDLIDFHIAGQKAVAFGKRVVKRADLINFCFHMEQLTAAGVPILEGLGDLRDSLDHPRFREIVTDLIESIEGGLTLSEALRHHDEVFDNTFTSLITAGESSGKLAEVFRNLSDSLKWQDELAAQTKKIITYPIVVAIVVLGVTFFLMIVLVPQLTSFIKNMGGELPFHTRALIAVSNVFIHYWYVLLTLPLVAWFGGRAWLRRSDSARMLADGLKLRLPLIGPVLHKIILARFATFFGLMYGSGITILECIRLSEGIVANRMVAAGLQRAAQLISEGQSVTLAFQNSGIFPPLVLRMLRVGEATGSLDNALRNVSYFYNREVKEMIERVQSLIEPAMTVTLGLLLGWIMLSVLGPIYDTMSQLKT
ncbi:type II secretion system F family protein [Massilia antarctica]|uniref:type II secretion system F family protein n=1 Tax=Massilia antarctica TaxID=2765360 RepID=UPI0006BB9697|nr:type II secretion system F family protein [Massilia sp. H27-R4]MCY0910431.1 type II secretion system F family protein [Massilia sp. H27-R4]CUI09221.1 Type II secretory pathway, component PulF / Type IV fimbrial assembly protein PilC [Janthinobacterium sp. CG23_2]CUU33007.1 Type II secretory pathway, component PulF / Type IV fimbrial assembly protein PilC [Janthinobacterium sp. CG23_2]